AAGVGIGLAALAYAAMLHQVTGSVSEYFLQQAIPGAGGHNVVNVILVDFRALDTLGEITVLAIVALTVFALLRRFRPAAESIGPTRQQRYFRQHGDTTTPTQQAGAIADYLA